MEKPLQFTACWLLRGTLLAGLTVAGLALGTAVHAQTGQGQSPGSGAQAQGTNPAVSPSPADLEPGVNTSAIQPSSPDTTPPAAERSAGGDKMTGPAASGPAETGSSTGGRAHKRTGPRGSRSKGASGSSEAARAAGPAASASGGPGGNGSPGAEGAATGASPVGPTTGAGSQAASAKTGEPGGKAHDRIQLDATQITGNRELPKVLYIVPWKRSDLGDLVGKPVNSLLDEVLTPVDRDVFKRQNRYYDALKPDAAKDSAGAATEPEKR